jgi:hypothetical protein
MVRAFQGLGGAKTVRFAGSLVFLRPGRNMTLSPRLALRTWPERGCPQPQHVHCVGDVAVVGGSRAPETGAHLDTTAGRGGPKSEIRNPKPETNSNAQCSKAKNRQQGSGFGHSLLGAWGLFRVSSFGFRVFALWGWRQYQDAPQFLSSFNAPLLFNPNSD